MKYIRFKHIIKPNNSIKPLTFKIYPSGLMDGEYHVVGVDDLLDHTHPSLSAWEVSYVTYENVLTIAGAAGHDVPAYAADTKYDWTDVEGVDGEGQAIVTRTWSGTAMTADEISANTIAERKVKLLEGFLFEGVMCSATGSEMANLKAVEEFIEAGNSTVWEFKNGNELLLTPANLTAFKLAFTAFRQGFFRSA